MTPLIPATDPESYPLAILLSLTKYDRLLYLAPSGLLLDPASLDTLFDTPLEHPMTSFPFPTTTTDTTNPAAAEAAAVFLIHPSKSDYTRSKHLLASDPSLSNPTMLVSHYHHNKQQQNTPQHIPSSDLIMQTSSLLRQHTHIPPAVKFTTLLASTAYIHIISDPPHIPGPEYAVPRTGRQEIGRDAGEASRIWEFVYERFREDRMRVCGLDLERWD